jgi:hypothetical protein
LGQQSLDRVEHFQSSDLKHSEKIVKAVHLICGRNDYGCIENLTTVDMTTSMFQSGDWAFKEDDARSLIGGWIYLHPAKSETSEIGGVVSEVKCVLHKGDAIKERVNFTFESRSVAKGKSWRGAVHRTAWTSGIIEASLPHEFDAAHDRCGCSALSDNDLVSHVG